MPGSVYSPRDVHDLDNQPYFVKVYYEEPDTPCTLGGRKFSYEELASLSASARRGFDPQPVPEIPWAALTLFRVPPSVISNLPAVTRRLFGASVPIESLTTPVGPPGGPPRPPRPPIGLPRRPDVPGLEFTSRDFRLQDHAKKISQEEWN